MSVSILTATGPMMVGPSSSHTAGALKLGQFARAFFNELPEKVEIYLYGSFGEVYKGHATDKAIIAGILNLPPHDENVINAFDLAKAKGLEFQFFPVVAGVSMHPNTAKIVMKKGDKELDITGCSVGGGVILIKNINGFDVEIKESPGLTWTIIVMHQDGKGVLHTIASNLTTNGNNICAVHSVRSAKEGDAITIVETDERIDEKILERFKKENKFITSIFEIER